MQRRLHVIVSGLVQGVFYRASTQQKAVELGLSGWVMNRPDGTVELVAEGPEDSLGELLRWCESGPQLAEVTSVMPTWDDGTKEFDAFTIRR